MEDEIEERGISLSQVFAVMFGRKKLFFIIWAAVFVVGVLGLKFIYAPMVETYTGTFAYTSEELNNEEYTDGSKFDVSDFINLESLNAIKESNSKLSGLNMEKIVQNDGIKMAKVEVVSENNDGSYALEEINYKLVFSCKYIKNETVAAELLKSIANIADAKNASIISSKNYTKYLELFDESMQYESQISYLKSQYNLIHSTYTKLISEYGDVNVNGSSLSDLDKDMTEYMAGTTFSTIYQEVKNNGYVKSYEYSLQSLKNTKMSLEADGTVLKNKLADLEDQRDHIISTAGSLYSVELEDYNSQIIDLTMQVRDNEESLRITNLMLDNQSKVNDESYKAAISNLESRLSEFREKLEEFTDTLISAESVVLSENHLISYKTSSYVTEGKTFSNLLVILIPLVAGLLLGVIVNLILDGKKLTSKYALVYLEDLNKNKEVKEETAKE